MIPKQCVIGKHDVVSRPKDDDNEEKINHQPKPTLEVNPGQATDTIPTMKDLGRRFRDFGGQRAKRSRLFVCLSLFLTSLPYSQAFSARIANPQLTSERQSTLLHSQATSAQAVDLRFSDFAKDHHDTTAPPVLLLHGLLGSKRNFATIGNSLASQLEHKRRIIGLDMRNHGTLQKDMLFARLFERSWLTHYFYKVRITMIGETKWTITKWQQMS